MHCDAIVRRGDLAGNGSGRRAHRYRWPVAARATGAGAPAVRRYGLGVRQPPSHPPQARVLGRHRRVDVPAPTASWPVQLAAGRRSELADQCRAVAMVGGRGGLAAPVGTPAGAVAAVNR